MATPTGVELIQIIHEELLKSAELTGIWEKKLREIEKRTYNAGQFLEELKQMVSEVVMSVLSDNSNRHITIQMPAAEKNGKSADKAGTAGKPEKEPRKRTPRKPKEEKKVVKDSDAAGPCTGGYFCGEALSSVRKRYGYQGENGLRMFRMESRMYFPQAVRVTYNPFSAIYFQRGAAIRA